MTQMLNELRRKRIGLIHEARSTLHELRAEAYNPNGSDTLSKELERKHDAVMRDLALVDLDIDEERSAEESEATRAAARPGMGEAITTTGVALTESDEFARVWSQRSNHAWTDDRGNPIRVLRPTERFGDQRASGPALGDTVRAMITGPRNESERRALAEGTNSAGGYTVPTPLATMFIDRLRSQSVAIKAGALTVPMTSATLAMARLETDPTIGWRAENAALAEGDPTFGRVLLTAKSLAGIVKISRELAQDTANAGTMIEQALSRAMALEIDRAAIFGDGSSNSPTGITGTSGINEVSMGTNGAVLNTDKMLDAIYEMLLDNASAPTAAILHPRTMIALQKLKDGQGMPVTLPSMLAAVPMLMTTAAPITETQGSATNASSVVFGDFRELIIGMRENITIQVLDQLYADNGQIALAVHARCDVQLAHKESFSRLKGIIP